MKTGQEEFPEASLSDVKEFSVQREAARPCFLLLAGKGNQRELHKFTGISQETVAAMIGTTRSRVNLFMNEFRMLGFIKYHGSLDANGGYASTPPF